MCEEITSNYEPGKKAQKTSIDTAVSAIKKAVTELRAVSPLKSKYGF